MSKARRKRKEMMLARKHERNERDARVTAEHGEKAHRMCGSKNRYRNKGEALVRASYCVRRGSPPLRAYHCPYCGGWHLTHLDKT